MTIHSQIKIFKNGLLTGLLLQLAIGPVFFFVVSLVLQRTLLDGIIAVLAVTIVDYLYITLAILGLGKLLERKWFKRIFGFISSIVLIIFGWIMISDVLAKVPSIDGNPGSADLFTSFVSVFLLTLSSPLTIVFFTSLFAAKAVEYNYTRRELLTFGLATGSATAIFLGTAVILIAMIGAAIPVMVVRLLNLLVGVLISGYGVIRLLKVRKEHPIPS